MTGWFRSIAKGARVLAAMLVVGTLIAPMTAAAESQPRDNNANSIMWGGCYTKDECLQKINNGDGHNSAANLQQIYYHEGRGITQANFMSGDTVSGTTYKDGRVVVNGVTVATAAQSVGRHNFAGTHPSGSVWESTNQVSFLSDSIPAWVNMEGGTFHYMVIKSCGNPGRATPTPQPTPQPTPKPTPKPSPSPSPSPSPEMTFACVDLKPTQTATDTFRFTVDKIKIENVDLTGYRFTLQQRGSDNAPDVQDTDANKNFIEYTLGAGTWDVNAQVKTSAGITEISEACSATVKVTQEQPSPSPTPKPTGQVLSASLPATGPEALLGGAAGLTATAYAGRAYWRSRKSLLNALRTNRTTRED